VAHAAQRGAHHGANALAVLGLQVEPRVLDGQSCRAHRKLTEAVQAPRATAFQEIVSREVVHLRRDVTAEGCRVEACERGHRRLLAAQSAPEPGAANSDRRDGADPGNHDLSLHELHR